MQLSIATLVHWQSSSSFWMFCLSLAPTRSIETHYLRSLMLSFSLVRCWKTVQTRLAFLRHQAAHAPWETLTVHRTVVDGSCSAFSFTVRWPDSESTISVRSEQVNASSDLDKKSSIAALTISRETWLRPSPLFVRTAV